MNRQLVAKKVAVPLVSIVMAVYNGAPYLAETLQSVIDQTFTDFEFIIVDDGSTDDTWQILNGFARRETRLVLYRNQPNQGVVRALNRGLDAAQGSLIARQDADDVSMPERLTRQIEFLEMHPDYGCVGVTVQQVDAKGTPIGISYNTPDNESIQKQLLDHMCMCGPTIMVRRGCLKAIGYYFSECLNAIEDYDLCLRLAEVTKLAVLDDPLYLYRQHPQSASRIQEQRQAFNKAVALERAIYRRYGPSPSADKFVLVGKDYLRAAVIGVARKDLVAARSSLGRAIEVYPPLLDGDQPLEGLVRAYTPNDSVESALRYTESMFDDLLPKTRQLARMRARLLSDLHLSEVFAGANQNQPDRIKAHLWLGIRYAPRWMLNRGVVSILFKSLFQRNPAKINQRS
jgi:glycosyltransferase involved in cell wall biosynthesis